MNYTTEERDAVSSEQHQPDAAAAAAAPLLHHHQRPSPSFFPSLLSVPPAMKKTSPSSSSCLRTVPRCMCRVLRPRKWVALFAVIFVVIVWVVRLNTFDLDEGGGGGGGGNGHGGAAGWGGSNGDDDLADDDYDHGGDGVDWRRILSREVHARMSAVRGFLPLLYPARWSAAPDADEAVLQLRRLLQDIGLASPLSCKELDAAHVVSSASGNDDDGDGYGGYGARNPGLPLEGVGDEELLHLSPLRRASYSDRKMLSLMSMKWHGGAEFGFGGGGGVGAGFGIRGGSAGTFGKKRRRTAMVFKSQGVDMDTKVACIQQEQRDWRHSGKSKPGADSDALMMARCSTMGHYQLLREVLFSVVLGGGSKVGWWAGIVGGGLVLPPLGYCLRGDHISEDLGQKGVILAVPLGQPLHLHFVKQKSYLFRLQVMYEIASVVHFLSHSPLGSLRLTKVASEDFIVVRGHIRLSDLDDLVAGELPCKTQSQCVDYLKKKGYTASNTGVPGVQCAHHVCEGLNEKLNLYQVYEHLLLPLMKPHPQSAAHSTSTLRHQLKALDITSTQLVNTLTTLLQQHGPIKQPPFEYISQDSQQNSRHHYQNGRRRRRPEPAVRRGGFDSNIININNDNNNNNDINNNNNNNGNNNNNNNNIINMNNNNDNHINNNIIQQQQQQQQQGDERDMKHYQPSNNNDDNDDDNDNNNDDDDYAGDADKKLEQPHRVGVKDVAHAGVAPRGLRPHVRYRAHPPPRDDDADVAQDRDGHEVRGIHGGPQGRLQWQQQQQQQQPQQQPQQQQPQQQQPQQQQPQQRSRSHHHHHHPGHYVRYNASNLPGVFDYVCPESRATWGCVKMVFNVSQAKNVCDTDPECQAFIVLSGHPEEQTLLTVIFKNSYKSVIHPNAGSTLFVRVSVAPSVPVPRAVEVTQPDAVSTPSASDSCLHHVQAFHTAARSARQKRLHKHIGLKGMSEDQWMSVIKECTVSKVFAMANVGQFLLHMACNRSHDPDTPSLRTSVTPVVLKVLENSKTSYVGGMIVYTLDRLLGLYHTPPSTKMVLSAARMAQVSHPELLELAEADGSIEGLAQMPQMSHLTVQVPSLKALDSVTDTLSPVSKTDRLFLEYVILVWLAKVKVVPSQYVGYKGHVLLFNGDQSFTEYHPEWLQYFNQCQFPNIVYRTLLCYRCSRPTSLSSVTVCGLGEKVFTLLQQSGVSMVDTYRRGREQIINAAAADLLTVLDVCIHKHGRKNVLY